MARRALLATVVGLNLGCSALAGEQDTARRSWEAREAERARECLRAGGQWAAGACQFRAPS